MQALHIVPEKYIKQKKHLAKEQECSLCWQTSLDIYKCNGPCQKIFCYHCANGVKDRSNECPFRCSNPFQVSKQIIEFYCPFDAINCQEPILSYQDFSKHITVCDFAEDFIEEDLMQKLLYRCKKGHTLFFLDDQALKQIYGSDSIDTSQCAQCKKVKNCRGICPLCSSKNSHILYCQSCRKPPCTKNGCFKGHMFDSKVFKVGSSAFCDFCCKFKKVDSQGGFLVDNQCKIKICSKCSKDLYDDHPMIPFSMARKSINHLSQAKCE